MESGSDLYNDVVGTYLRIIRQDSPEAAAALEKILFICGSRAALRSTLIITILKMEMQKSHSLENIAVPLHLIKAYPEALPLLERAIALCAEVWGIPSSEPLDLTDARPARPAGEPTAPTFTHPSV